MADATDTTDTGGTRDDGGGFVLTLDKVLGVLGIGTKQWNRLKSFASNPWQWLSDLIWKKALRPWSRSLWYALVATVSALLTIFFGSDHEIGISPGTEVYGILDIPFLVFNPTINAFTAVTGGIADGVMAFNNTLATKVAGMGPAAPIFVNFMIVLEVGVAVWIGWIVITSVDIPFIDHVGLLESATYPIRNILGWFK